MSKFVTTFTANGITIGGELTDPLDHFYFEHAAGLGTVGVRLPTQGLARAGGDFDLKSYASGRVLTIEGFVIGATKAAAAEKFAQVKQAFGTLGLDGREAEPVTITNLGYYPSLRILAKIAGPITRNDPWQWQEGSGRIDFQIPLYCPDWRLYEDSLTEVEISPFAPSEGLSYPVTYPKIYGAGGSGSGTILTNDGDADTWPLLNISGPVSGTATDPILENVTSGERIALTNFGGVTIAPGQTLIVDTHPRTRSIAFATGASRYGKISTDTVFWNLDPGDNEIRFRLNGTVTGAKLTVQYRDAYR